ELILVPTPLLDEPGNFGAQDVGSSVVGPIVDHEWIVKSKALAEKVGSSPCLANLNRHNGSLRGLARIRQPKQTSPRSGVANIKEPDRERTKRGLQGKASDRTLSGQRGFQV